MKKKKLTKKLIVIIILVICAIVAGVVAISRLQGSSDEVKYTQATASERSMVKTLTAAGEVKGYDSETIDFSTSKTFSGMCVEENEQVKKGQPLIKYRNGTYYTAPADGVVTSINAPDAGTVADDKNSITFERTKTLGLDITVPEDQINQIERGSTAKIIVNSDSTKEYEGTIKSKKAMSTTLISEKASSSTTSTTSGQSGLSNMLGGSGSSSKSDPFGSESSTSYYTVSLEFDNDGTISPGMSAGCTVTLSERKSVLTVPIEAVYFTKSGKAYVWKGDAKSASKQVVELGDSDANYVEITEGLSSGDKIRVEEQK